MRHLSSLSAPLRMRPAPMPALARQHTPALEGPRAASTAPLAGDRDATATRGPRSGMSLPAFQPTREAFEQADQNGDGTLDLEELLAMVKDPALLRWLLERLDTNGDGRLDRAEWPAAFPTPAPQPGGANAAAGASGGAPGSAGAPDARARRPVGDHQAGVQKAIEAIRQDPALTQAFAQWDTLSTDEKMAVGQRISATLGAAFGFEPSSNLRHDASLDGTGTLGLWSSAGGIAFSREALADPAQFLDTVVHEQMHHLDAADGVQDMIDPAHNTGRVQDTVYHIGHAVSEGVFGARAA